MRHQPDRFAPMASNVAQTSAPASPSCILTLVHGTFATRAKWVHDGSTLRSQIMKRLGKNVLFVPFHWSGKNSVTARDVAASRLGQEVSDLHRTYPNSPLFIIGHSHGGNVAARAAEYCGEQVHGVVSLSTPFIVAEQREFGVKEKHFLLAVTVATAVTTLYMSGVRSIHPGLLPWMMSCLAVGIAIAIFETLFRKLKAHSKAVARKTQLNGVPSMLVIRSTGDEASTLLIAMQFASHFLARTFGILSSVCDGVARLRGPWLIKGWKSKDITIKFCIFWGGIAFMKWLALHVYFLEEGDVDVGLKLGAGVIALLAVAALSEYIAGGIMLLILPIILMSLPFAFFLGIEAVLASSFVDFSVEAIPVGPAETVLVQSDLASCVGLRHSATYDDAQVITHICDWIEEKLKKSRRHRH